MTGQNARKLGKPIIEKISSQKLFSSLHINKHEDIERVLDCRTPQTLKSLATCREEGGRQPKMWCWRQRRRRRPTRRPAPPASQAPWRPLFLPRGSLLKIECLVSLIWLQNICNQWHTRLQVMSTLQAMWKCPFVAVAFILGTHSENFTTAGMMSQTNKTFFLSSWNRFPGVLTGWVSKVFEQPQVSVMPSKQANKLSASIGDAKQTALHLSLSSQQPQIKTPLVRSKTSYFLEIVELTSIQNQATVN